VTIELPMDPDHEIYHTVHPDSLPPLNAYYYLNPGKKTENSLTNDLDMKYRKESMKSPDRRIFDGWDNLTEFEIV
jgi:hypothetical protein